MKKQQKKAKKYFVYLKYHFIFALRLRKMLMK